MTLVLGRLVGEQIVIGEEGKRLVVDGPIIVTLLHSRVGAGRIGIDADEELLVLRREVYERQFGPLEPGKSRSVPRGSGDGQRMRRSRRARSA